MNAPADECVILGSGRSILDLSDAERAYLTAHPNTLALNKFLLFHEKAGVVPKAVFVADFHYPAPRLVVDLARMARRLRPRPHFFLHEQFRRIFRPRGYRELRRAAGIRKRIYREHGDLIPFRLAGRPSITYFRNDNCHPTEPFYWARSLDELLYFHRGSLTSAINLAAIVFEVRKIKLVGVDLNSDRSFFAEEIGTRPRYKDPYYDAMAQAAGRHMTAIPHNGIPPVQSVIPKLATHLESLGIELVNASSASLLRTDGLCRFEPLLGPAPPLGASTGPAAWPRPAIS